MPSGNGLMFVKWANEWMRFSPFHCEIIILQKSQLVHLFRSLGASVQFVQIQCI